MSWPCTWFDATERAIWYLRRYTFSDDVECPADKNGFGHNAQEAIGEFELVTDAEGYILADVDFDPLHQDERWPAKCACGYEFQQADMWQVRQEPLYKNAESGVLVKKRELPIGAMIDMWWDFRATPGPDGKKLGVVLPPGGEFHLWCVDGPSNSGGGWTRNGDIPNVTASPSILTSRYHGFLQGGVLTDTLPDRPDPFGEPVRM